jgi:nitronate monooxygenase
MKYWMRSIYALTSLRRLKKSSLTAAGAREYWQAGKSVAGIDSVRPVADLVSDFAAAIADP